MKKILLLTPLFLLLVHFSKAQTLFPYTSVSSTLSSYNSCTSNSTSIYGFSQLNIPVEIGYQSCGNTNFSIYLERSTGGPFATVASLSVINTFSASYSFPISKSLLGSGTYRVKVTATGCGYSKTGYSTTYNVVFNNQAVSNFKLFNGTTNYAISSTVPTTICPGAINSFKMSSLSTGTITASFVEVMQVSNTGAYTSGAYSSKWYSYVPVNALVYAMAAPSLTFIPGNYYKIKLAVQGPCTNWSEKVAFIYIPNSCKTDGSENTIIVEENPNILNELAIYPNPTNQTFKIEGNTEHNYVVNMTDMQGKVLNKFTGTLNNINSELAKLYYLSNGMYLIQIRDLMTQESKTEKLIKQ